ncbi:Leucine-rich repeat-containing protein 58 [Dictyocoela muelleri]|nr:Leucine-rich repeat-containing protein 58 [Dictyocoela muelleri]
MNWNMPNQESDEIVERINVNRSSNRHSGKKFILSNLNMRKIPEGVIRKVESGCITKLYVKFNFLHEIPPRILNKNLIKICASYNQLDDIPQCIGNLTLLKELDLSFNKLRYLPAEILNINLNVLKLKNNPLMSKKEIIRFNRRIIFVIPSLYSYVINSKIDFLGIEKYCHCSMCRKKCFLYANMYSMVYSNTISFPIRYVLCSYFCLKRVLI